MLRYPFTTSVLQARLAVVALALGAVLALPSCADDDDDTTGDTEVIVPDELFGLWESNFGGNEGFSDTEFYGTGYGSFIRYVDPASRLLVTQNRPDDMFSPDKFSKVFWTAPADGSIYYCTADFGLDSLQDALDSTATADATNPATGGCGGFSWTKLTQIETFGVWESNFGGTETIDRTIWSYSELRAFSNSERWAVTQNKADDMFNPSKFNRFVWTAITGGSFYYCTVDFGLATLNDALTSTKTADDSDPDDSGCGGFSWTKLSTPQ